MEMVTISIEEYAEHIRTKRELEIIRVAAEDDTRSYGYDSDTAKVIDTVLGIERNK